MDLLVFTMKARYLVLFGNEKCDSIHNRTRYHIGVKSGIAYIIPHDYAKIKIDSYDSLPLEKTMAFRYVIILIESVWNKNQNHYCYLINFRKSFVSVTWKISSV